MDCPRGGSGRGIVHGRVRPPIAFQVFDGASHSLNVDVYTYWHTGSRDHTGRGRTRQHQGSCSTKHTSEAMTEQAVPLFEFIRLPRPAETSRIYTHRFNAAALDYLLTFI
jgi:hypothetical protein